MTAPSSFASRLPVPIRRAFRPSRRPQWVALVVTLLLASLFPYFEQIHSANELARLYLADALVHDGTVAIDGPIKRHTPVPDKARRLGKTYSDKAPGIALAIGPGLFALHLVDADATLASKMRVARLFGATIPIGILLVLLSLFLARLRVQWSNRVAVVVVLALASPLAVYGVLLFGHGLAATLLFATYYFVVGFRGDGSGRDLLRSAGIGALAGFAVCVEYPCAVFLLPSAVLFLIRAFSTTRSPKILLLSVGVALLGAAPFAAGLMLYHHAAFGSPFATGYAFLVNKNFASVHAQGFMGITFPKPLHFLEAFFSLNKGLFFFCPALLLAVVPGFARLRQNRSGGFDRPARWVLIVTMVMMVLFVSAMVFPGGGWTVGQRHLVVWLPFAAIPLGLALQPRRGSGGGAPKQRPKLEIFLRTVMATSIFAGFSVSGACLFVWPYLFDDLFAPVPQLIWPALTDGWRVPSVLHYIGLPSTVIAAAALLIVIGSVWWLIASAPKLDPQNPLRQQAVLLLAAVVAWGLFLFVVEVTAPDQPAVVAKRRQRLEAAYVVDPGAHPRRKSTSASPAETKRMHKRARGLSLSVRTTAGEVMKCRRADKNGKTACPKFGAGVFVRPAIANVDGVKTDVLRAYLPRKGGTLQMRLPVSTLRDVESLSLLSFETGAIANVSVRATQKDKDAAPSLLSRPGSEIARDGTKRRPARSLPISIEAPRRGSVEIEISAGKGDRELFLLFSPRIRSNRD